MTIENIIGLAYLVIGGISAGVALVELCSIGKKLPKGLPFTFLGIMFFGNLILWPIFIPTSIKQYREIKKQIALKNVGKVSESMEPEHDDQLATFIDNLSKRYPEVSFAKLSRIAVAVSRWETERAVKIIEEEMKRAEKCKGLSDDRFSEYFEFWDGYGACAEYLFNDFATLKTKLAKHENDSPRKNHRDRK